MNRLLCITTFAILFTCYSVALPQQRSDVMRELLSAPAPTPRTAGAATEPATELAPKVFDKAPPDDAPIEDLFEYWMARRHDSAKNGPSDTVRQRLLDATVDDLEALSTWLPLFRSSESYAEKIKQALDNSSGKPELEHERQVVKKWLVFNSKYFLGELLSLANKVKDRADYGSVENGEALTALAKLDWSRAEPLLQTLANTGERRTSTLALRLLYEHSVDAKDATAELKFRTRLQSIAADKNFPGHARDTAIEALSTKEWSAAILSSNDPAAQIGVLAAARLTQTPLPINLVGPLLKSKNALLATAAERYLLAEDSKEAQTLLREHHPNEAFITGWRENLPLIGGDNFDQIGKLEEKLRAELLKRDGPTEIFAMLANSDQYSQVLRIYSDKAVYTFYEDATRYRERVVPKTELAVFKEFISNNKVADLGPQIGPCHHNCWVSQFVMLSKDTGRRVFSHGAFGDGPALVIHANLERLGSGEGATTEYNFGKEIKVLEVLYADQRLEVKDVWQRGDDIRIFVEREETEDEKEKRKAEEASDEDENITTTKYRQRELERLNARLSWRTLKSAP